MAKRLVLDPTGALRAEMASEGKPLFVRAREVEFTDFASFAALLNQAVEANGAIIHGEVIPGTNMNKMRRLMIADGDTPATIRDRVCPYLILDIDQLPLPDGLTVQTNPDGVIEYVRTALPAEIRDVSFWYHHSHSAGTKPLVKLHLALLLDEPKPCAELERWVKYFNEQAGFQLFDPAPYSPNDFVFIGNPILGKGVTDPIPPGKRCGAIRGKRDSFRLEVPETWRPIGQRRNLGQQGVDPRTFTGIGVTGIAGHLKRLGAECHGPIVDAVKVAFRDRELLVDDGELEARITRAIENAEWDWTLHPDDYLAKEEDDLGRVIAWRRRIEEAAVAATPYGVPAPRFASPEEATKALGVALDSFFRRCTSWQDVCDEASLEEGTAPNAPLMAVRATTGVGKTRGVVSRLLDSPFRAVLYVAPTHAVLEEIRIALEAEQAKRVGGRRWVIEHVYGRTHKDSAGKFTMCKRGEVANAVQKVGGNVGMLLCGRDDAPLCPHYSTCPFIAQQKRLNQAKDDEAVCTVTLVATDTLPHRLPGGVRQPDFVVIDESFWQSLTSMGFAREHGNLKIDVMGKVQWSVLDDVKDPNGNVVQQVPNDDASITLNAAWREFMTIARGFWNSSGTFFPPSMISMSEDALKRLRRDLGKCRINVDLELGNARHDKDGEILSKIENGTLAKINSKVATYRALIDALLIEKAKVNATATALVSVSGTLGTLQEDD